MSVEKTPGLAAYPLGQTWLENFICHGNIIVINKILDTHVQMRYLLTGNFHEDIP
jgi:hypothetical protein